MTTGRINQGSRSPSCRVSPSGARPPRTSRGRTRWWLDRRAERGPRGAAAAARGTDARDAGPRETRSSARPTVCIFFLTSLRVAARRARVSARVGQWRHRNEVCFVYKNIHIIINAHTTHMRMLLLYIIKHDTRYIARIFCARHCNKTINTTSKITAYIPHMCVCMYTTRQVCRRRIIINMYILYSSS
jgi:hypothetical protein